MDDARERVDELGEEATQNESLGAALDQAYAARFGGTASSAPAAPEDTLQSNARLDEFKQAAADQSSPGEVTDAAEQASEAGQPDLADSGQVTGTQAPSLATREPEQAAPTAEASVVTQHEATAASENGAEETEAPEESAQAADEQQGGATAAASVHAVPAEAAAAAASASDAAAAAPLAGDDAAAGAALVSDQHAAADRSLLEHAAGSDAERAEPEQELPKSLDELGRRILDWHWSHLEYGCSAPLHKVRHFCMPFTAMANMLTPVLVWCVIMGYTECMAACPA